MVIDFKRSVPLACSKIAGRKNTSYFLTGRLVRIRTYLAFVLVNPAIYSNANMNDTAHWGNNCPLALTRS